MTTAGNRAGAALLVPLGAGAVVAVVLGVYGSLHTPTGVAVNVAGFSSPMSVKAWLPPVGVVLAGLAPVVVVLAIVQLLSALAMYGKLGRTAPAWVAPVHRWSGRLAFLVSI